LLIDGKTALMGMVKPNPLIVGMPMEKKVKFPSSGEGKNKTTK
jgi:hypothetical protein